MLVGHIIPISALALKPTLKFNQSMSMFGLSWGVVQVLNLRGVLVALTI